MKTFLKKLTVISVVILLVFAMVSCANNTPATEPEAPESGSAIPTQTQSVPTGIWADADYTENTVLGEGSKTITVEVIAEGKSVIFTVKTDADTLGAALLDNKIVEGEVAQYGLYIKYANGIRADYDLDGAYWGLSKNGEYMMSGADTTKIADGERYELTYTKG